MEIVRGIAPHEALALAQGAGWDYTEARVRRALDLVGEGAFSARDASGAAIGMATCAVWDDLAWIGGMIVAPAAQRRGTGRALLRRALAYAEEKGARTVGLDATSAGRPLYEAEGFVAWRESAIYERPADAPRAPPGPSGDFAMYPVSSCEIMELLDYDRPRFGASRARLLSRLISEDPHRSFVAVHRRTGAFSGLALAVEGRIGALVAEAAEAAAWLLHACERAGARPRAFVAEWNADAVATFARAGYVRERACMRMFRGEHPRGEPHKAYALPTWSFG